MPPRLAQKRKPPPTKRRAPAKKRAIPPPQQPRLGSDLLRTRLAKKGAQPDSEPTLEECIGYPTRRAKMGVQPDSQPSLEEPVAYRTRRSKKGAQPGIEPSLEEPIGYLVAKNMQKFLGGNAPSMPVVSSESPQQGALDSGYQMSRQVPVSGTRQAMENVSVLVQEVVPAALPKPQMPRVRPPIPPSFLSVVCDNMFTGLGRKLRTCGVNAVMLGELEPHSRALEISNEESRDILTTGSSYESLRRSTQRIMHVTTQNEGVQTTCEEQIAEVIKHFNVIRSDATNYSRCEDCNSHTYDVKSVEEFRRMRQQELDPLQESPTIDEVVMKVLEIEESTLDKLREVRLCNQCGHAFYIPPPSEVVRQLGELEWH